MQRITPFNGQVKKTIYVAAQLLVSLSLLIWLLTDVQWQHIRDTLSGLPPWGLWAMLGIYIAAQLLSSLRWQLICHGLQLPATWRYLLNLYFIGMFFNSFLPTSVGGDAIKSYTLGKTTHSHLKAAQSILLDRLSGMTALLLLAVAALLTLSQRPIWISNLIIGVAIFSSAFFLFLPILITILGRTAPRTTHYLAPLRLLYQDTSRCLGLFALALLIQGLGIIIVAGFGHLLGIRLSIAFYIVSWTAITLITLLPISFNGIGVREAGFVYLFGRQGVPEEVALSLSLLTFAIPLCAGLLGIIPLLGASIKFNCHKKSILK